MAALLAAACRSPLKAPPVSEGFRARILWSASGFGRPAVFSSNVFVKGNEFLRIDMSLPFYGAAGSLALSRGRMTVRIPSKRQYLEGPFDARAVFPDISPFPPEWLFALLRAEPLPGWPCEERLKAPRRFLSCRAGEFQINWVFSGGSLRLIELRDSKKRLLRGRARGIAGAALSDDFFVLPKFSD